MANSGNEHGNSGNGHGTGNGWQPPARETGTGSAEEERRIEDWARHDAYEAYQAIQRRDLWIPPDGDLWPLAVDATHAYLDRLRQESQAIPRWTRTTGAPLQTMRDYWQWIGDRYSEAFHTALSYHCSMYTRTEGKVIPTLPPVTPALVTAQPAHRGPSRTNQRRVREA